LRALHDILEKRRHTAAPTDGVPGPVGFPDEVREMTEYADVVSAQDELDTLALELHDPAGNVVSTEWIWFQDTHRLIALGREEMTKLDPDLVFDDDDAEPWQPQPPRYQIMVGLEGYEKRMDMEVARLERRRARKNTRR
jgi:hypothetical protein